MSSSTVDVAASFAQVRVGQVTHGEATDRPAGAAGFLSLVDDVSPCPGAVLADLHWSRVDTERAGTRVEATVTRWRVAADTGTIHQDIRLLDATDKVVEHADAVWRVSGVGAVAEDPSRVALDFGSQPWARLVAERLSDDAEFTSATASFDGSIGLAVGEDEVDLRIYKGSIIEVNRKSLQGATFTIAATELTWVRLFTDRYDDYVRLAARGAFRIKGSGFQYLRMTKAVRILVSRVRSLVADVDQP